MLIANLADQGRLSLDDPVNQHIPELPAYSPALNVRHLLGHTSGLRDYTALMSLAGWRFENSYSESEILRLICRQQALNFVPGDEFVYSNSGYFLLGCIAQRLTGRPLWELLQSNIIEPLGMRATYSNADATTLVRQRTVSYSPSQVGGYRIEISPSTGFGDGPILTTIEDLFLWDQNFYRNRLPGGQAIIQHMLTSGQLNSGLSTGYGLGLFLGSYRGLKTVFHGGGWAGYRAEIMRFPSQQFTVILLANTADIPGPLLIKKIADIYLEKNFSESLPVRPAPRLVLDPLPADYRHLPGIYRNPGTGALREITLQEGVFSAIANGRSVALAPLGNLLFDAPDRPYRVQYTFHEVEGQMILSVTDEIGGLVPERLIKIEPPLVQPSGFQDYCGVYASAELASTYVVYLDGDQLLLQKPDFPAGPLHVIGSDIFTCCSLDLTFLRDPEGKVCAIQLHDGRARALVFSKQSPNLSER